MTKPPHIGGEGGIVPDFGRLDLPAGWRYTAARPDPGSSPRRSVSAASGCGAPAQPVVDSAARIRSVTAAGWEPQPALELYTDAPTARWPSSYERGQPLLATGECPGGCTVALWPGG